MTLSQVTTAIFVRVRDGVAAIATTGRPVAVLYDGTAADVPRAGRWVRVSVRALPTSQRTHGAVGSRIATRRALAVVQVFAPLEEGDGPGHALDLAASIRPLLEGADLEAATGTINFTGADVRPIGADAGWYQANVDAQITYQEQI